VVGKILLVVGRGFSLGWAQGSHVKISVFIYFLRICLLLFLRSGCKINLIA